MPPPSLLSTPWILPGINDHFLQHKWNYFDIIKKNQNSAKWLSNVAKYRLEGGGERENEMTNEGELSCLIRMCFILEWRLLGNSYV